MNLKKIFITYLIINLSSISYSQDIIKRSTVCGFSNTIEMTISGHGTDTVIVSTNQVTSDSNDVSLLSVLDGTLTSTHFCVPNDGNRYRIIYFNSDHEPYKIPNGQGAYTKEYECKCSEGGTGVCTMVTTGSGDKGCTNTSCTHCCDLVERLPSNVYAGPAVILRAEILNF